MRRILPLLSLFFLVSTVTSLQAQELTSEYKEEVVLKLNQLMNDFYVFPEVAKETETHLLQELKEGAFDQFKDNTTFAKALTSAVQYINKDKHMRIRLNPPYEESANTPARMIEERLNYIDRNRRFHDGFHKVEILEGNVGYFDIRAFAGVNRGKHAADAYMQLIKTTDAIIVDLRKNGGGDPYMVQYLCSYFFDKKTHLNSLYFRPGNRTDEFWTLDEVDGEKLPDIPLYVLTGSYTFSGAEEFSYNMQTQKRATLIGVTTGGGANPGGTRMINDSLSVFIPTGRAINPITNTNWEGVGVIPDIKVAEEDALTHAHELAMKAAEAYRNQNMQAHKKLFLTLNETLESYDGKESGDQLIQEKLGACIEEGLLEEFDINILGYEYLTQYGQPAIGTSILKANTYLFPESANTYDSYGEALLRTGKPSKAASQFKIAVEKGKAHGDPNLNIYQDNLKKANEQAMGK